jgi:hypothetical protein
MAESLDTIAARLDAMSIVLVEVKADGRQTARELVRIDGTLHEVCAWRDGHETRHARSEVLGQAWAGWGRQIAFSLMGPAVLGFVFLGLRAAKLL